MSIFVNHAHVFPKDIWPEGDIDHLLQLMDECNIEKAVAFAPFFSQWKDHAGSPVSWLAKEISSHKDRIIGYAAINPESNNAVDMLLLAKELGFQGVKMHPAFEKWSLVSPKAYEFYRKAEEISMILDFHTGVHWHRISHYNPLLFDEIACDFPKLTMVFEHVGGYHFFNDMLAVLVNNSRSKKPRLFAGIASVFSRDNQKYWYLGPENIKNIIWQVGDDCLIYGLDFPYNTVSDVKRDLQLISEMDIPEESKSRMLGGNLKSMLSV